MNRRHSTLRRSTPAHLALLLMTAAAGLLSPAASSQSGGAVEVGRDPYTRGNAKAIAAAGYVKVGGPMAWAEHDTIAVEELLGQLPFIWIETAHFRIGSTLPEFTISKKDRKKIHGELARLKEKLPKVKSKARRLDRWLRAHLFAQRCEDAYARFCAQLGVEDEDFPARGVQGTGADFMGVGPYLGQGDKYLLLLLDERGSFERYAAKYLNTPGGYPRRFAFGQRSSLLFGTAIGYHESLADDTRLHCQVARNITANFIDGLKSYCQEAPAWIKFGFGMVYARGLKDDFTDYDRVDAVDPDIRADGNWRPRIYKLVKNGGATSLDILLERSHCGDFKFRDYLVAWSLAEYLTTLGDEKFASFISAVKRPLYSETHNVIPSAKEMHEHQLEALREAYGMELVELQAAWHKWVLKTQR